MTMAKASVIGVRLSTICNNLSLGMVIKASTCSFNSEIPYSACCARRLPSKLKGRVTTPTVRAPISFATLATMGAAPVPVPPPIPAVTNTISEPPKISFRSSLLSSADLRPISGFPPEPRPLVNFVPICNLSFAVDFFSACTSVFTATKSTPFTLFATI